MELPRARGYAVRMSYKTILVHAGPDRGAPDRIRLAARLARAADAHLVGAATTGISRLMPAAVLAAAGPALADRCAALRQEAGRTLEEFDGIATQEGVASTEARLVDDEAGAGLALQARYCDLAVVGQAEHDAIHPLLPPDLPDYVVLAGARPVLVVPFAGCAPDLGAEAVVGWDGSVEATHALDAALPLLRAARHTSVFAFANQAPWPDGVEHPDVQLIAWLGRHGIAARLERRSGSGNDSELAETLLSEAAGRGAGLLVIGAYGHARLRELLLGGVTAAILRTMTLPVLLAH